MPGLAYAHMASPPRSVQNDLASHSSDAMRRTSRFGTRHMNPAIVAHIFEFLPVHAFRACSRRFVPEPKVLSFVLVQKCREIAAIPCDGCDSADMYPERPNVFFTFSEPEPKGPVCQICGEGWCGDHECELCATYGHDVHGIEIKTYLTNVTCLPKTAAFVNFARIGAEIFRDIFLCGGCAEMTIRDGRGLDTWANLDRSEGHFSDPVHSYYIDKYSMAKLDMHAEMFGAKTASNSASAEPEMSNEIKAIDQVIQVVDDGSYAEQVEVIPCEEAACIESDRWTTTVERQIQEGVHLITRADAEIGEGARDSHLVVLTFGRHPQSFDDALMNCPLAARIIAEGFSPKPADAKGTKMLARGVTTEFLVEQGVQLSPKVVIVEESDEHEVYEALMSLPYAERPRVKQNNGRWVLEEDLDLFADVSDDDRSIATLEHLPVKRTFVHFSASSASSDRTVSTSQLRQLAIGNPRSKVPRHEPQQFRCGGAI